MLPLNVVNQPYHVNYTQRIMHIVSVISILGKKCFGIVQVGMCMKVSQQAVI